MRIAVASGKGGTGKTTVAVSLALAAQGMVHLLECDVEEPNAALFLKVSDPVESPVCVPIPLIDETRCTACGECARFCEFNAIVRVGKTVLVFPELCHSCGGCALVCPEKAIREVASEIGTLTEGRVSRVGCGAAASGSSAPDMGFYQGLLSIGKAMSPPVIRAVKGRSGAAAERRTADCGNADCGVLEVIDAPPGTSCPMGTALTGVDYVILVTEPTPFGLHDLRLAIDTVRAMDIPFGVIINRSDSGDDRVVEYCSSEGIRILLQIPEERRIAAGYSRGEPLIVAAPEYRRIFSALAGLLVHEWKNRTGPGGAQ